MHRDDDAEWRAAELDEAAYDMAQDEYYAEQARLDDVRQTLEADLEEWFDEYFDQYFRKKAAAAWEPAWLEQLPKLTDALRRAKHHIEIGEHDEASVLAATATEVLLRECLARPMIAGMFLGGAWAPELAERITDLARGGRIRELVLAVLRHVGLDLAEVKTLDGTPVWSVLMGQGGLIEQRNAFVHELKPTNPDVVRAGLVAAIELLNKSRLFGERLGADAAPPGEI